MSGVGQGTGECIVRSFQDEATMQRRLEVVRADPIVRVSADLLQEISVMTVRGEDRGASLVDDVLTIHGSNRTVVYRVDFTDWDSTDDSYRAEWPD